VDFDQIVQALDGLTRPQLIELAEVLADRHDVAVYRGPGHDDVTPKEFAVTLVDVGPNLIYTLKILRDLLGTGLKETKEILDSVPRIIAGGVYEDRAREIASKLEAVGAKVVIK